MIKHVSALLILCCWIAFSIHYYHMFFDYWLADKPIALNPVEEETFTVGRMIISTGWVLALYPYLFAENEPRKERI